MTNSAKWEQLANEAIADAGEWKREARKAQAQRDELVAALQAIVDCDLSTVRSDYNQRLLNAIADAHDLLAEVQS